MRRSIRQVSPDPLVPGETMRLRDGRALGFAQFGDPSGTPVFFFHGAGDSRLQRHEDDRVTRDAGVRLITVDRPGVGLSDFRPYRRLVDWPEDVAELADALGIHRFAILGYSMGGPHALACAYRLSYRLSACSVVSGIVPFDPREAWTDVAPYVRRFFTLARRSPRLIQPTLGWMAWQVRRDAEGFADRMYVSAPVEDQDVFRRPGRRDAAVAALREAARQGSRGLAWELAMVARPWRFRLEDIVFPVTLWYGTADRTAPVAMGEYLARALPRATLIRWPDDGHQAIFLHWREVLEEVSRSQ